MKKVISALLSLALLLAAIPSALAVEYGQELNPNPVEYEQTFEDVPKNHWAFQYIAEMVRRGAVSGYPDGLFRPEKTVTRSEFAKIMLGAAGVKATAAKTSSFVDVPLKDWASPFVETAKTYMTGYLTDKGMYFKPTDGALREDIAVAVVKLKGYDTRLADLSVLNTMFKDVESISASLQPYVAIAVENGLLSGYPDGTFRGQGTIARSEAAAVLWRAFQYGSDEKIALDDNSGTTEAPTAAPSMKKELEKDKEQEQEQKQEQKMEQGQSFTHTMDTVATSLSDYQTMILTNDDVVYYVSGNTLQASDSKVSVDLLKDGIPYQLDHDDKNYSFALNPDSAHLAYDGETVYLLINENRRYGGLKVFDVTDLSNSQILLAQNAADAASYEGNYRLEFSGFASPSYCLSNGGIVVLGKDGSDHDTTLLIQPRTGSVQDLNRLLNSYGYVHKIVYGNEIFYLDSDKDMMAISSFSSDASTWMSVQGGVPSFNANNVCAGPNGIYYWDESTGLVYIDREGWLHTAADSSTIECVDFMRLPNNIWDIKVNSAGSCAFYDNSSKSIRLLTENG